MLFCYLICITLYILFNDFFKYIVIHLLNFIDSLNNYIKQTSILNYLNAPVQMLMHIIDVISLYVITIIYAWDVVIMYPLLNAILHGTIHGVFIKENEKMMLSAYCKIMTWNSYTQHNNHRELININAFSGMWVSSVRCVQNTTSFVNTHKISRSLWPVNKFFLDFLYPYFEWELIKK